MKLSRIFSLASFALALIAVILVLKRPAPVAVPQSPQAAAANAESFQNKIAQIEQSSSQSNASPQSTSQASEVHITSEEVTAAISQAAGTLPVAAAGQTVTNAVDPASQPDIKDYKVNFEGDQVHGQFLTKVAGKDVWVTVSGHLSSKDGYAQFDPTEFKVGDLSVPVSLVNGALQKKLAEQKDQLKLPDSVSGLKVENGELVVIPK